MSSGRWPLMKNSWTIWLEKTTRIAIRPRALFGLMKNNADRVSLRDGRWFKKKIILVGRWKGILNRKI